MPVTVQGLGCRGLVGLRVKGLGLWGLEGLGSLRLRV